MVFVCVCVCSRLQPCVSDLQPYACDQVELWCQLAGWGLVRVGTVPVTYDAHFRCTFPEISAAELHSVHVPRHGQRSSAWHRQTWPPTARGAPRAGARQPFELRSRAWAACGLGSAALEPLRCATPQTPSVTALAIQVPNDVEEPRRTEPPGRSGHAVSLAIKDERRVLAVAEQMVARHIPGLK